MKKEAKNLLLLTFIWNIIILGEKNILGLICLFDIAG